MAKSIMDLDAVKEWEAKNGVGRVGELPDDDTEEEGEVLFFDKTTGLVGKKPDPKPEPERAVCMPCKEQTREDKLQEKIEFWQDRIGLTEWQLWSTFIPPDGERHAEVSYDPYHFQGTIQVNDDLPEDQWDWTVVHEELHILLEPIQEYVSDLLSNIDPKERKVLEGQMERSFEPVYNRLAKAIVGTRRPKL